MLVVQQSLNPSLEVRWNCDNIFQFDSRLQEDLTDVDFTEKTRISPHMMRRAMMRRATSSDSIIVVWCRLSSFSGFSCGVKRICREGEDRHVRGEHDARDPFPKGQT